MTEVFERLIQKMDSHGRLLRVWELQGGVSAQVTALEIEHPDGQTQKLIVRRHGEIDRQRNPHIATEEFRLSEYLQSQGLRVPKPYYVDESGQIPCLVMEYVEGQTDFAPANLTDYLYQLATHLAQIHRIDSAHLVFLPKQADLYSRKLYPRPSKLDDSIGERQIREILESVSPLPQHNPMKLLHGDFWPGNILWEEGQLAAVIDWEDAQIGDPLADVANSRLEVLWVFGAEAMREFTRMYQSITDLNYDHLPYWDLYAALRPAFKISEWAGDVMIENQMRERHEWFVQQAHHNISK